MICIDYVKYNVLRHLSINLGKNEEETLADITNAFEIFDRDDDGKLQTKDLHRYVNNIAISCKQYNKFM